MCEWFNYKATPFIIYPHTFRLQIHTFLLYPHSFRLQIHTFLLYPHTLNNVCDLIYCVFTDTNLYNLYNKEQREETASLFYIFLFLRPENRQFLLAVYFFDRFIASMFFS